jgi:nicotinamide-nucleotide amidase
MFSSALIEKTEILLEDYRRAGKRLATVESCTGGLVAALLTEIPGSSDVVERGLVTYSNAAKQELVAVPPALIERHGAVSGEVAEAMAAGVLAASPADVAVSTTGIAGPGGATPEKPVGLVYLGLCRRGEPPSHRREVFAGDRRAVRLASLERALSLLAEGLR